MSRRLKSFADLSLKVVAAPTVGGQARRPQNTPANKEFKPRRINARTYEAQAANKNEIERMKMQTTSSENKKFTGSPTPFAFPAPTTRQVSLAGDFNNWDTNASPMHKGPDGIWRLSVPLAPGRYEYRFFADEVWQDDPAAQQRATNALGTENCVRIVAA